MKKKKKTLTNICDFIYLTTTARKLDTQISTVKKSERVHTIVGSYRKRARIWGQEKVKSNVDMCISKYKQVVM